MRHLTKTALALMAFCATPAFATDITVTVTGIAAPVGQIGCGLHSTADSFPMGHSGVPMQWVTPQGDRAECRFVDVAPGTYAIAVAHDVNGNRQTDTTLIGLPTEQWGVSRNVRPALRAPRFAEAAFEVADAPVALTIEVAK